MATFGSDTFTGTDGTVITTHTPNVGGSWNHPTGLNAVLSNANRLRGGGAGEADNYISGTPANADYDVQADLFVVTAAGYAGPCGRSNTTFDTQYQVIYNSSTTRWELSKGVANSWTVIGTFSETLAVSSTTTIILKMHGTSIVANRGGTDIITVTDSAIATAGVAGTIISATTGGNTDSIHLDNFTASDFVASVFPPLPHLWHSPLIPM